jgi:hypothetical protein
MRHVVRAVVQPRFVCLELGEAIQHLALRSRGDALELVDARDQRRWSVGGWFHIDTVPGEEPVSDEGHNSTEHVFGSQGSNAEITVRRKLPGAPDRSRR